MILKPLLLVFVFFSAVLAASERFVVKLHQNTILTDFIPLLLDGVFHEINSLIHPKKKHQKGHHHHRRCLDRHAKVHHTYEIGNLKALLLEVHDRRVVQNLPAKFPEIEMIVPDHLIQFGIANVTSALIHDQNTTNSTLVAYGSKVTHVSAKTTHTSAKTTHVSAKPTHTSEKTAHTSVTTAHTSAKPTAAPTKTTSTSTNTSSAPATQSQTNALWNLVRISETKLAKSDVYIYDKNAGAGVNVYVLDDGLELDHEDFEGRAKWGWSAVPSFAKEGGGHGTHVAGIIGGAQYGVAKKVSLTAVQVLNKFGQGSLSNMLGGIQWIMQDFKKNKGRTLVNMSLGMPTGTNASTLIGEAVSGLVESGLPVIVAAGNSAVDACDIIPAGVPNVFTVSSIDVADVMNPMSAFGKCVDVLAPGVDVRSTFPGPNKNETALMTGTSMASPHAAGVAALLLPYLGVDTTPQQLYKAIESEMVMNQALKVQGKTPNAILHHNV
ncbi:peptidase S8/S53 domain-containing protein [Spinellus fusiger]|nr:peptidase S8/S53 domain-containing protein [Spinellus fusiger]